MFRIVCCAAVVLSAGGILSCLAQERAALPEAASFYVATNGNDAWSGTLASPNDKNTDGPFATLQCARDAVRELKRKGRDRDVLVLVRGGVYRPSRTVVFTLQDTSPPGHCVTYAAYPGERPVFSAGVPIVNWQRVREKIPGLPATARGKVWSAPVPPVLRDVAVLFDGERRMARARGKGFAPPPASACKRHGAHRHDLHVPESVLGRWSPGRRIDLVVVPTYPWVMNVLPVTGVDASARVLHTDVPSTYPLGKVRFGVFPEGTAWIENAIEDLDEPGEWIFDAAARRVILWPGGQGPSDAIVAPALTELIRVEGAIDYDGPTDTPVCGLVFRGLTFTHGDRFRWEPGKTGWGLQHDWEMFDRPTALLRLRGAERCIVEDCRLVNSGGTAVRLDLHAQHNVIRRNLVAHVGGAGVLLAGYGPGKKNANRANEVSRNHIHHVGELLWHSPGIFAWQSGENRIVENVVHHTPYTAIVVSGRIQWNREGTGECSRTIRWKEVDAVYPDRPARLDWHAREPFLHGRKNLVQRNEIHHVMEVMGDGNCIYVSGTGGGNEVRDNVLHDVTSPRMNAAIRCDDDQHDTVISGNLIWRTCGEGFIIKGNNTITNNVVADLRIRTADGTRCPHTRGFLVLPYGDVKGATIQRNIFYSTDKAAKLLTESPKSRRGAAVLRACRADFNLYWCTRDPHWADAHLRTQRAYGIEQHSINADPLFVAPDKGDFRLKPGSPALKLGFRPLDSWTGIGKRPSTRER